MPIRFRCVGCGGILAIARRKAGANVLCPKCSVSVVVPGASTVPDPDKAEAPVRSAVAGEAVITDRKRGANGRNKTRKAAQAVPAGDPPLFERLDFESLLQPAVAKANEIPKTAAPAVPPTTPPQAKIPPRPVAKEKRREIPAGYPSAYVQISRVQLIAIVILVFCLVAMAVGVGYALGK
ncbi:MAG TPA: hypothetical protein VGJ05_11285 [Fimbriiglobus sp.]|jgi:hypothetical protein